MSAALPPPLTPDPSLVARLEDFVRTVDEPTGVLPWVERLSDQDHHRLRDDLGLVLSEPQRTGEPVDWREVHDILAEYAGLAGWDAAPAPTPVSAPGETPYRIDVRPQELRAVERASAAVQQVAGELLSGFLPHTPTAHEALGRGRLKKLANRDIWQIELPDGFRLRYLVDELERVVYVLYLGPHPDGAMEGRERAVRARVQRARHEQGL